MDSQVLIISALGGFVLGGLIAYFLVNVLLKKRNAQHVEEMNAKADLQIQEARLTAKRLVDEAELKSEKIIGKAERENEKRKQQKIQEAQEHFQRLKSKHDK